MIKTVEFDNFRNLSGKYEFNYVLNVIVGKNNTGKTNLLDGIRLAFSQLTGDFCKVSRSDFKDSDDNNLIRISIELEETAIPSLNYFISIDGEPIKKCGFQLIIRKTQSGRYVRELCLLDGGDIAFDVLREDPKIPNIYMIPLLRVEDIYTNGLTAGILNFIESETKYRDLMNDSKDAIKKELKVKENEFSSLCKEFGQELKLEVTDPKIANEKVYIVDGDKEHNIKIGSGYKSIANIMLNTLNDDFNIILIDEIENHLHPALIRTLIKKLKSVKNVKIIASTHSPVVINELEMKEIVDISGIDISFKEEAKICGKLNTFLHPGRNELILADNVILVEGYTEEILFRNYLKKNNRNWTVVNVAGVMFEPYILLACKLNKKVIVISDNDKSTTENNTRSTRFENLVQLCESKEIRWIEIENTLETDLYLSGLLNGFDELLKKHYKYPECFIAKEKKKMAIIEKLITTEVDISKWHVIEEIENEFKSN